MRAWLNGDLMADPTQGAVSVTDHGFTVGDGVFEAIKTLDGQPFALTRHLFRLERSAAGLGLPAPDLDDVRRGVEAVIDGDPIGRLRITYSAGPHPMGSGRGGGPPTLVRLERPGTQLSRVVLATAELVFFYTAVRFLPLADVMTFYLAGPIYIAAVSPFIPRWHPRTSSICLPIVKTGVKEFIAPCGMRDIPRCRNAASFSSGRFTITN